MPSFIQLRRLRLEAVAQAASDGHAGGNSGANIMNATDLFKSGKLQAALDAQLQDVKAHPADQNKRLFLFELACFTGDLDRAHRQIDLIQYDDPEVAAALQTYRAMLNAEQARRRLFSAGQAPKSLAPHPEHVAQRLQALNLLRANQTAEAGTILAAINLAAPSLKGTFNDKPFDSIRDADDLFGTVLEVLAHGEYYWVPLEQVQTLTMNPPKYPRDLLWRPARLEMEGAAGDVFLPVLYPGTHEKSDEQLLLGRTTDWVGSEGAPVRGVGARTFMVGDDGVGLLEFRQLVMQQ
jgi:type VI secretion system protein ImpE